MSEPSSPPLRLLVVDDCKDTRDSLDILLRMWGHEVLLAPDGPSALEACGSFRPHVVLLDITLPGMDGWEVARRIRERDDGRQVLLLAVTGHGRGQDRDRSAAAGFDAHLTKPAHLDRLEHLLATACHPSGVS